MLISSQPSRNRASSELGIFVTPQTRKPPILSILNDLDRSKSIRPRFDVFVCLCASPTERRPRNLEGRTDSLLGPVLGAERLDQLHGVFPEGFRVSEGVALVGAGFQPLDLHVLCRHGGSLSRFNSAISPSSTTRLVWRVPASSYGRPPPEHTV